MKVKSSVQRQYHYNGGFPINNENQEFKAGSGLDD